MYFSNTDQLRIAVVPSYKDETSSKHHSHWEYSVFIENNSKEVMQLISKSWRIIYADGSLHEISGNVSADEQQIIEPGTILELRNTASLRTSSAIIKGNYIMTSKGQEFNVEIPTFSLDNPYQVMSVN